MSALAACAFEAGNQITFDNCTCPYACAECHHDSILHAFHIAEHRFADDSAVRVVADIYGKIEIFFEFRTEIVIAEENIAGIKNLCGVGIDRAGNAHAHSRDLVRRNAGVFQKFCDKPRDIFCVVVGRLRRFCNNAVFHDYVAVFVDDAAFNAHTAHIDTYIIHVQILIFFLNFTTNTRRAQRLRQDIFRRRAKFFLIYHVIV